MSLLGVLFLSSMLVILILLVIRIKKYFSKDQKHLHLPPSPPNLPIIGNLHQIGHLPYRSLHALSKKNGPLMLLQLGQVPMLVVSSADMAREVMSTHDHVFANRPSMKVPTRLLYGCKDIAFAPYGDYWRRMRKYTIHHLLGPARIRSHRLLREEEVAFLVDRVTKLSCQGPVDMSEVLSSFAKDVVSRVVFGKCSRDEGWNNKIDEVIDECNVLLGAFHVGDFFPALAWLSAATGLDERIQRTFKKIDAILNEIIDGHVSSSAHPSRNIDGGHEAFLDLLLANDEGPVSKETIKPILEDLFGAGTDSTIIVLEWTMAELVRHPKAMKRLQEEVNRHPNITEESLAQMSYLKAVVKETMRLHPPGPLLIPRESMGSTQLQGYHIPSKTRVIINAWAIGRDPSYWEDPEEFRPERFLDSAVDFKGGDFQLIPFGAGRRMCIGLNFAVSIIELALANLVRRFDWGLPLSMKDGGLDMTEAPGITTRKQVRLQLVANPTP